ncbi:hypothetical protein M885DRAFT_536041 [Pelagophyceae sp. CCMP2097]|nr:hypothetical protein M885DRAFT_536041 [Pelagophyceae sp. CCMP2097]|mmetsp:Transcript_15961/g.53830  ORF Transcript_15961/g.53830 Transcript_15961/m.53830 type:complete len:371 (+) Transcript_15961:132-1244(+)
MPRWERVASKSKPGRFYYRRPEGPKWVVQWNAPRASDLVCKTSGQAGQFLSAVPAEVLGLILDHAGVVSAARLGTCARFAFARVAQDGIWEGHLLAPPRGDAYDASLATFASSPALRRRRGLRADRAGRCELRLRADAELEALKDKCVVRSKYDTNGAVQVFANDDFVLKYLVYSGLLGVAELEREALRLADCLRGQERRVARANGTAALLQMALAQDTSLGDPAARGAHGGALAATLASRSPAFTPERIKTTVAAFIAFAAPPTGLAFELLEKHDEAAWAFAVRHRLAILAKLNARALLEDALSLSRMLRARVETGSLSLARAARLTPAERDEEEDQMRKKQRVGRVVDAARARFGARPNLSYGLAGPD